MILLPGVYLLSQLLSGLASLPAPVNVWVQSQNFHHVLHWQPGPGSPSGTQFIIFRWTEEKRKKPFRPINSTSYKLKLDFRKRYRLAVQASYNDTVSPLSHNITFAPLTDTKIGPPLLSVAGRGTSIQVNISLPAPDKHTKIDDMKGYYDVSYIVQYKKGTDGEIHRVEKYESYDLDNLQKDVEYCVRVLIKSRTTKNTLPSVWRCTYTSIPGPRNGIVVLTVVTSLLVFLLVFLTMVIVCLYYTGFLCKLKEMSIAPLMILWPDHVLTPSTLNIDQVTIIPQAIKQRNGPMCPSSSASEDSDDEDGEAGVNLYMDRNAELSSDAGSYLNSPGTRGNLCDDSAAASGGSMGKRPAEAEKYEAMAETVSVSVTRDEGPSGLPSKEGEIQTETQDFSGNVNLFSVVLSSIAALGEGEVEEDQESESSSTDFLQTYTTTKTDSQGEPVDQTFAPSEDNMSGYKHADRSAEIWTDYEEEEEEEEEFSGYLTNT